MRSPQTAVHDVRRSLAGVLILRRVLIDLAFWFLAWGTGTISLRILGFSTRTCLTGGAVGALIVASIASYRALRSMPSDRSLLALLDARLEAGGLIAASADLDTSSWSVVPIRNDVLRVEWAGRNRVLLLTSATLFVIGALVAPIPDVHASSRLDVRDEVKRLAEQIQVLKEESIVPPERAAEMNQTLAEVQQSATGEDPSKAWATLDAVDETTSIVARNAAEEAMQTADALTQIQMMATGAVLDQGSATPDGMRQLAEEITRVLAADAGAITGLSKETQDALAQSSLSSSQLSEIARAAALGKSELRKTLSKLAAKGLIDPKALRDFDEAAAETNKAELARFLKANRDKSLRDAVGECLRPGRGGVDRGRADATMWFGEGSREDREKFKDNVLPPAAVAALKDSDVTAVSAAVPQVEGPTPSTGGKLQTAPGAASAVNTVVLPRHRGTVERFFDRKPK